MPLQINQSLNKEAKEFKPVKKHQESSSVENTIINNNNNTHTHPPSIET
jgi:hypothetical protein